MSGLSDSIAAALAAGAGAAAGRELDDEAGAMLAQALEQAAEPLGVGGRRLVVVADVGVDDRGAGLDRGLGRSRPARRR